MSLRLRIVLAFLAVVSLLVVVGLISVRINTRIQSRVEHLRPATGVNLEREDLLGVGVEVEGLWHDRGGFAATEIERLPSPRRPKLRGVLQAVDAAQGTVSMYGVAIHVTPATQFLDDSGARTLAELRAGERAEISCSVDPEGRWTARKIRTRGVKDSDKIKGTVTRVALAEAGPDTLEVAGIQVLVSLPREEQDTTSPLFRIDHASEMALSLQRFEMAASELLEATLPPEARIPRPYSAARDALYGDLDDASLPADARLQAALDDYEYHLLQCVAASQVPFRAPEGVIPPAAPSGWIDELKKIQPEFRAAAERFQELAARDPQAARRELDRVLEPLIQQQILPAVYAFRGDAEEALTREVRAVAEQADTTTRLVLATSVVAVLVALVLGLLMWRSISRPIRALHEAALAIARGRFDTRVDVQTRDELGVLAGAFNKMAEELATTTVSVGNLESVLDSMAAALVLVGPDGSITSVNRAAAEMLGYRREELHGQPFARICPDGPEIFGAPPGSAGGEPVSPIESRFMRRDGTDIPVSLSRAALRTDGGPARGFVCVALDLTERKRNEERIRQSLAEKELLLREVHHRVKNNLQVITSLLDLQSASIRDPEALEKFEESQNRVRSMALIHEQLYRTDQLDHIDFRTYLDRLTSHLLQSYGRGGSIDLAVEVDDAVQLDLDQALSCGLIVNELVTNALKHAFPEEGRGSIRVTLEGAGDSARLTVHDDGRGLPADLDVERSASLGMSLVTTLVKQLRGNLQVHGEGGTRVHIEFPAVIGQRQAATS